MQAKKKENVKNTNKPRNRLTQTHDLVKKFLVEFQCEKIVFQQEKQPREKQMHLCTFTHPSFIHSLTGQIVIEHLLYNETSTLMGLTTVKGILEHYLLFWCQDLH